MPFVSSIKFLLTFGAIVALSCCFAADASAQRGFRIGNVLQAGGGQGFRLGGPRFGMHFGGGQGASIGGQNFGMRFGNGQGARFGGANIGMQFGGGQGTQIGQLRTTTSGAPGTYYYGDVKTGGAHAQPMARQPIVGPSIRQPTVASRPVPQPTIFGKGGPEMIPSSVATPTPATTGARGKFRAPTQSDIARQSTVASSEANTNRPEIKLEAPLDSTGAKSVLVTEEASAAKTPVKKSSGDDK